MSRGFTRPFDRPISWGVSVRGMEFYSFNKKIEFRSEGISWRIERCEIKGEKKRKQEKHDYASVGKKFPVELAKISYRVVRVKGTRKNRGTRDWFAV